MKHTIRISTVAAALAIAGAVGAHAEEPRTLDQVRNALMTTAPITLPADAIHDIAGTKPVTTEGWTEARRRPALRQPAFFRRIVARSFALLLEATSSTRAATMSQPRNLRSMSRLTRARSASAEAPRPTEVFVPGLTARLSQRDGVASSVALLLALRPALN